MRRTTPVSLLGLVAVIALAGLLAILSGCASSGQPANTGSTPSHAAATPTVTVTASPKQPAASTAQQQPATQPATPRAAASSAEGNPAAVVVAYYDAINAGDWRTAWNLGGDHLAGSYSAFVDGFADTLSDTVTITGTDGDTVSVRLTATQTDGSDRTFAGTYRVSGGHIVAAHIAATGGAPASGGGSAGVILAPDGGHYAADEYCPAKDAGLTTKDADGNTLICVPQSGHYYWQLTG